MEQNVSSAVTIDDFLATVSASVGDDLLIEGPAMSGKHLLAYRALAQAASDSRPICVTTTDTSKRVREAFESAGGDSDRLLVVDAVSRQSGVATREDSRTRYASSPADLTGIGMALTGLLEQTSEQPVVLVDNISSLLLYSELDTVFRFLHLLTGRVEAAEGRTIQLLNTDSHSSQDRASITQLFELLVDLRLDDDSRSVRLRGGDGVQTDWQPLDFETEGGR
ncbi:RecA-superfamily ATPase, KaiC/GvpD/RAD55 family [Halogranum gelatinilyticum]|uniref:RecA-superfamily ATPase, KaiC/GvpD/RAD55 family n=1 Tax=Halogranum gelatinilyticum TaxID=660521 RepID=A0A1G9TFJ7_9EURY|nr:ATPase domain-containing protein [Halogranum gelatinilyticum]SDM46274.1 RecA-superfamily ATPase, KaiC/GvpD/RAD55 family [Halogranum gelatinilyticum]